MGNATNGSLVNEGRLISFEPLYGKLATYWSSIKVFVDQYVEVGDGSEQMDSDNRNE